MSRPVFWPTRDAQVSDSFGTPVAGQRVRIYAAQSGGSPITDLTFVNTSGAPTTVVPSGILVSDANGLLPAFAGPDGGPDVLFGDFGAYGVRLAMVADPSSVGAGGGGSLTGTGGGAVTTTAQVAADTALAGTYARIIEVDVASLTGVDPTGAADSTTALQAAFNTASAGAPKRFRFRAGLYKISTALTIPFAPGSEYLGVGMIASVIQQQTAGQPVFKFTTQNTHSITIADLSLNYATAQTNAASIAVFYSDASELGNGFAHHRYNRVAVRNAFRGFALDDTLNSQTLWDVTWDGCQFYDIKDRLISLVSATAIGIPQVVIKSLGAYNNGSLVSTGPALRFQACEVTASGIDIEGWNNELIWVTSGGYCDVRGLHAEHHKMSATNSRVFYVANGPMSVTAFTLTGATTAGCTGSAYIAVVDTGGSASFSDGAQTVDTALGGAPTKVFFNVAGARTQNDATLRNVNPTTSGIPQIGTSYDLVPPYDRPLTRTAVKSGAYTAAAYDLVPVDTTSAAVTITLPTAPEDRARVVVKHIIQGGSNAVTVQVGGSDVLNKAAGSTSYSMPGPLMAAVFEYQASTAIWTITSTDIPLAYLSGLYIQQMPAPTGVSATDCANFAAALTALPTTGGRILLQSRIGGLSYNFTNGVTINKTCEVVGQGGTNAIVGSIGKSDIVCTSTTATPITVTAPAVRFSGFSLRNTAGSAATAGAGILVSGGSNRDGFRYEGITVANFFVGINHAGGNNSWLRDCTLLNCISHEVIWDCGDSVISGNEFRRIGAADAGVGGYTQTGSNLLITTAQGVKIGDNKFLGGTGGTANDGTYCIEVTVPDGHLLLDTIIHDNSIEGYGNAGVWVRNAPGGTTGQVSRFQIQDNQFGTDASNYHVLITNSTASPNNFTHFIVDGNQFYGATHDVEITNCFGVLMGANESSVGNQQATLTNSTNVVKTTVVPGSFGGALFPTDVAYATLVGARLDAFELVIPFPCTVTGIAMYVGALGTQGNMDAGLHNSAGVLIASCGNPSYTTLTAAAVNILNFAAPLSIPAGTYWLSACSNYSGNTYGLVSQSISRAIAKQIIAPTGPTSSTLAGVSQLYAGRAGVSLVLQ